MATKAMVKSATLKQTDNGFEYVILTLDSNVNASMWPSELNLLLDQTEQMALNQATLAKFVVLLTGAEVECEVEEKEIDGEKKKLATISSLKLNCRNNVIQTLADKFIESMF